MKVLCLYYGAFGSFHQKKAVEVYTTTRRQSACWLSKRVIRALCVAC